MNLNLLLNIFNIPIYFLGTFKLTHIYQLKNYNTKRYVGFFGSKFIIYLLLLFVIFSLDISLKNTSLSIINFALIFIANLLILTRLIKSKKTPLVLTKKVKENISISIIIWAMIFTLNCSYVLQILTCFISPIISNFLNIKNKIRNKKNIKSAQEKIAKQKVKIVAITGSNGKTSVKNILLDFLSISFRVQATPASYNTTLGISKFINENLNSDTEILILEYGARHRNDIKKLCEIYGADIGIITTVAPQHIESFKSIENVFKTKQELSDFLRTKLCVFNLDNLYCQRMFQEKQNQKIGVSIFSNSIISVSNICTSNFKTSFDLNFNNQLHHVSTPLLGKHNVLNICLAFAVAQYLNVPIDLILDKIKKLNQTEHRLQYIKTNINILDDSYNCSISSATEAIEVLKSTKHQTMIVTPGIVECGKEKFIINKKLGQLFDGITYCVIVGNENKKAILSGIESLDTKPKILLAKTLEDAKKYFSKLNTNDTLLLLNDLPDDYN